MRIVIRADASPMIGMGHVMRCLTLARVLRDQGAAVTFATVGSEGGILPELQQAGYDVVGPESVNVSRWDWVVLDGYHFDPTYEFSMRGVARRIMVIDDLANRRHDCDLLLDQNLYVNMETRYRGLIPESATALTGPKYALLRPDFSRARARVHRRDSLRHILVFFGGSDPTNETSKTLHAIGQLDRGDLSVVALLGTLNPHRAGVRALVEGMRNVSVLEAVDDVAELMLWADLVIGAGGATSWERCCLGVPSLVIAVADNQIELSRTLADRGYQCYLGSWDSVSVETIVDAIRHCFTHFSDAIAMGLRGMQLVDGMGAGRVASAMGSL